MIDRAMLTNWRRFPRARVNCEVIYGDRFQSWRSHTRDISMGGCRVVGYYPFPVGKTLTLKLAHPGIREHLSIAGRVVRLYGGSENALGVVFQGDERSRLQLEQWIRKVLATEPEAERTVSRMPEQIPLDAQLRRVSARPPNRPLSHGELAVLDRLAKTPGGVSLQQLRSEWGADWERRAQVIFDLVAEGVVAYAAVPARRRGPALRQECVVETTSTQTLQLMQQLESEYGPLGYRFARQLDAITAEVSEWGSADRTEVEKGAASQAGPKTPFGMSWISVPTKKR